MLQRTARGTNHADLHSNVFPAPDPGELRILQELKQLSLKRQINFVDAIQEQGTRVGHLDTARLACVGTRKGPLFIAEEFTLQ